MERFFNPYLFRGQGGLITANAMLGPFANEDGRVIPPGSELNPFRQPGFDLKDFGNTALAVFLRWQLNPSVGLPSEPFKVWRRLAMPLFEEMSPATAEHIVVPPLGDVYQFSEPFSLITVQVRSTGPAFNALIIPLAGGVGFENMLQLESLPVAANGQRTWTFHAPFVTGVLVNTPPGQEISVVGAPASAANKIEGWELVETVGLPVEPSEFGDLAGQSHGKEQGLVGAEVSAVDAAKDRFSRGINPYGWHPAFPTGEMAPTWELPDPEAMAIDAQKTLLSMLHDALNRPASQQVDHIEEHVINPPQNPNGQTMTADDGVAEISPVKMLQMAVSTDPMQSVVLGFGTGYPYENLDPIHFGAFSLFADPDVADYDYMVTGLWADGLEGDGKEVELAALIPRPRKPTPPPTPADLRLHFLAHQRPALQNGVWVATSRLSWERLPIDNLSRVASFAFARARSGATGPADALMEQRPSGKGHMPIGNNENRQDPEYPRQSASDTGLPIPNNPGSVNARYGVCTQDLFGIWSPWATRPFSTAQPPPDPVNIISAELRPIDTGSGTVCPADLVVEFVVDWRVRSVDQIDFRGRLFAAATRHEDPPPGMPGGVMKSLGGAAQPVAVTYIGDAPSVPGGTVISLDAQGETKVNTPGFASQGHARRYRITVPNFSLDYAGTPHIGLVLQARLREAIAPGRIGAWGPRTKLTFASDPRSRPTQKIDIVPLASLPDAKGECHAIVSWQLSPAAVGYIVYQTTESRMRSSRNMADATPDDTTSTRFSVLKNAFKSDPKRDDFTRLNRDPLTTSSLDVALARGSQDIHLFVVIPISAGGVEGPWPGGPMADLALTAFIAPRLAVPAPPTLEAQRIETPGGFATRLRVGTRAAQGARPTQIDLYRTRVADAARQLDSMGLPIASLTASTGSWIVDTATNGTETWITDVAGEDAPTGSWKPQWYRAVAWSSDDPIRSVRKSRGRPSPAVPIVIPPPGPPPLSPPILSWPGGGLDDILVSFSSAAPLQPTSLGPHVLSAEVRFTGEQNAFFITRDPVGQPDPANPALKLPGAIPLDEISTTPSTSGTGLWRSTAGTGEDYRLFLRRPAGAPAGAVILRLTDPLGRMTERIARFPEGSILPPPILSDVDSFSVAGRGTFYTVTTDAPVSGPLEYQIRVAIRPVDDGGITPERLRTLRTQPFFQDRPGATPFRPRPGPVLDLGLRRPASPFVRDGDALVYQAPLGDVPLSSRGPTDGTQAPLYAISRQQVGGQTAITVIARADIRSILFEIIMPDGREVSSGTRG